MEEDHGNIPDILSKLEEMNGYALKLMKEQESWKGRKNILDNCLTPAERDAKNWAVKEGLDDKQRRY